MLFCKHVPMISKSDIIFAQVGYQHDIIFAMLIFCNKSSYKTNVYNILSLFYVKTRNFELQENTFDVLTRYDVIFHTTSDANEVIKVDVTKL